MNFDRLTTFLWSLSTPIPFGLVLIIAPMIQGQVIPDASLGSESSIVTPQVDQDLITGGAVRGTNLFHSFQELNVAAARSLFFSNPDGITRIFSRVTSNSPSTINGTLGVLGNANLFLLNPNGILFGLNAQLSIAGSFLASTGDRFTFADGTSFSAVNPEPNALLSLSVPTGLQLGAMPGAIVNRSTANGTGLTIQSGQTLALVGGNLSFDGGRITVDSGRIELASLQNQAVELIPTDRGFSLGVPAIGTGGTIDLRNQATITLRTSLENPHAQIHLVSDRLNVQDQSEIQTLNSSPFTGATIDIQANDLRMSGGGRVLTVANGSGPGGAIRGAIANQIAIDGNNPVVPKHLSGFYSNTIGNGTGGNITIKTDWLTLTQGGGVMGDTVGPGNGGTLDITATQAIDGRSVSAEFFGLGSNLLTRTFGTGQGGILRIKTGNLTLVDGAAIQTATFLDGPAGNLSLEVMDQVKLSGFNPDIKLFPSTIISLTYGSGRGGDVQLSAKDIEIENGANILTTNLPRDLIAPLIREPQLVGLPNGGTGDIGNVRVQAETITIRGTNARLPESPSQLGSLTFLEGDAGDVSVKAREIRVEAGGLLVSSSVLGIAAFQPFLPPVVRGDGGDLTVEAESIWVDGVNPATGLSSILGTQTVGLGSSGNAYIETGTLRITDGGRVSASTIAVGNAGNLVVNAREGIEITGVNANGQASTLGTDATPALPRVQRDLFLPAVPTGDTGLLRVTTPSLVIRDGGTVGVQHFGTGDAGQLTVIADRLILDQGGKLTAATQSGNGGNIDLQIRDLLLLRRGSQITAESSGGTGMGGNLQIEAGAIVAVPQENSDIIANAVGGPGGTITLRTGGLFGIAVRDRTTPASDITASSDLGLSGTVQIDQLTADPSRGLTELPTGLLNGVQQISNACDRIGQSRFVLTGRGGLPPDPRQQGSASGTLQDWRETTAPTSQRWRVPSPVHSPAQPPSQPPERRLTEAQGLVVAPDGTARLVAIAPRTIGTTNYPLESCTHNLRSR